MPKFTKNSENRWVHPTYRHAFCYRYRNGMVYTSIDGIRQATGYEWSPKSKRACMELLNVRLIQLQTAYVHDNILTLQSVIEYFHRDHVSKLKKGSQLNYITTYRHFFAKPLSLNYKSLREHIKSVIPTLTSLDKSTINFHLIRLNKLFNYAVENEYIDKNPIVSSMYLKTTKPEIKLCEKDEIDIFLDYFKDNPKMKLLIEFLLITALRISEAVSIEWSDIKDDYFIVHGKGDRLRIFPHGLFPRVSEIFNALSPFPKPFEYANYTVPEINLWRARKKLSVIHNRDFDHFRFHALRKTAINYWRLKGIDTETRNMLSGHSRDVEKDYYLAEPDMKLFTEKLKNLSSM